MYCNAPSATIANRFLPGWEATGPSNIRLNAFIGGQQSRQALDQVREFLRAQRLDRDLELKVLEVMDELERTVKIRAKFTALG